MILVNLPVTDLGASMNFYQSIGFVNNPHSSDETAAFMVWSETINVMLLTQAKWRQQQRTAALPTSTLHRTSVSCTAGSSLTRMAMSGR